MLSALGSKSVPAGDIMAKDYCGNYVFNSFADDVKAGDSVTYICPRCEDDIRSQILPESRCPNCRAKPTVLSEAKSASGGKQVPSFFDQTLSFSPDNITGPLLDLEHVDSNCSLKFEEASKPLKSPRERMKSMRSMLSKSTRLTSDDFSLLDDVDSSLASHLSYTSPCEVSIEALLSGVTPHNKALVEAELKLLERLKSLRELKTTASPVLVSLKEVLEETSDSAAQHVSLQIVNFLCEEDYLMLDLCSTTGLLSVALQLSGEEHPREVRVELAYLVGQFCNSNDEVLKLFLSAGGLEALAKLLDLDYETNKDLVMLALDCMNKVSELQRQEYLTIWGNLGVPERLAVTMQCLMTESLNYLMKTLELLLDFASGSAALKSMVCQEEVLSILVFALHSLPEEPLLTLLQIFEALSMELQVVPALENSGLVCDLVLLLKEQLEETVLHSVLRIISNLIKDSAARKEQLVLAGGLTALHSCISKNSRLSRIALVILAKVPETSKVCRWMLREQGSLNVILEMLTTECSALALQALVVWLRNDPCIEETLLESSSLQTFVLAMKRNPKLAPWDSLLSASSRLCEVFSSQVLPRLVETPAEPGNSQLMQLILSLSRSKRCSSCNNLSLILNILQQGRRFRSRDR